MEAMTAEDYGRLVKAMKPGEYRIPAELVARVKAQKEKNDE